MIKRRGKILISGFSNSGKSTLINTFLRKKISIVSHKVQTTNQKIRATLNYKSNELIFIDTPGIITTKKFFNKMLSRATYEDLELCDINLFVIDSVKQYDKFAIESIKKITSRSKKNFLVINKIDLVDEQKLLLLIKKINKFIKFSETFPISAKKNTGLESLFKKIIVNLPKTKSDSQNIDSDENNINFQLSEITREKVFKLINQEIPYIIKIKTLTNNLKNLIKISQFIYVKKESQKAILIGKGGTKIKHIGTDARKDMEKLTKKKVFLELRVFHKDYKNEN